jgi:hypothetical protein
MNSSEDSSRQSPEDSWRATALREPMARAGCCASCGGTEGASDKAPATAEGAKGAIMGGTSSIRGTGPGTTMPGRKASSIGTAASLGALGLRERVPRPGRSSAEAELRVWLATSDVEAAESCCRGRGFCPSEAGDPESELVLSRLLNFSCRLRLPPVPVGGPACKNVL